MGKDLQTGALLFLRPVQWELATPTAITVWCWPFCQGTMWWLGNSLKAADLLLQIFWNEPPPLYSSHLPDTHCAFFFFFICKGKIRALGIYSWITYTMFTCGFLGSLLTSVLNWLYGIGIHHNELLWPKQDTATCRGLWSEGAAEKQQSDTSGDTTKHMKEKNWEGYEAAWKTCTKCKLLFTVNCPNAWVLLVMSSEFSMRWLKSQSAKTEKSADPNVK